MGCAVSRMTTTKKTAAVAPAAADEDPLSSVARFCDRWFAAEEEEEDEERSDGGGSAAAIAEEIAGRFFSADRPDDILVFEHGFPATAPFHGVRFRGPKGPAAYRSAVSDRLSYRDASFSEPTVDDDGDEEMVSVRGRARCTSKSTGESWDERLLLRFRLDGEGKIVVWEVGTHSGCFGPRWQAFRPAGGRPRSHRSGKQQQRRYRGSEVLNRRFFRWMCLRRSRELP